MRLRTFQIRNCFGFLDSGPVQMEDVNNLIYVLGKNSSGKTAFLTALCYLGWGMIPEPYDKFANFYDLGTARTLEASFRVEKGDLSLTTLMERVWSSVLSGPNSDAGESQLILREAHSRAKIDALAAQVEGPFRELIDKIETTGSVFVRKDEHGNYRFSPDKSFADYDERDTQFNELFEAEFNNSLVMAGGSWRRVNITYPSIENQLFLQFPRIVFFDRGYSLLEDLPERITTETMEADRDPLLSAFISLLGEEKIDRFLTENSFSELDSLQNEFNSKLKELTDQVNRNRSSIDPQPLLGIAVGRGIQEGMQITTTTGGAESFYRHISDNTKFLFAYYLYRQVHSIKGAILLFDEPNNGFHASAQEYLLNFLKGLAREENLVVVSTHSEYLIDPLHLSGIRLMGSGDKNYPIVQNHYFSQLLGKNQGDYLALRPITDAIGLHYGTHKLTPHDKVVIVEGITDMLYFRAFCSLLDYPEMPHFAPARGDQTIPHIIPLFISQDIRLKIILDTDKAAKNAKSIIQRDYLIADKHIYEVPVSSLSSKGKSSGVEDLFSKADFKKLLQEFRAIVDTDFNTLPNSEYIKRPLVAGKSGPKRLVAAWFYERLDNYKSSDFDKETIGNFRGVLEFCKNEAWLRI